MKIKRIKTEKQLKAGNYIRAVINYKGVFWIEYQQLVGKPFNCKSKVMNKDRQINTKDSKGKYYNPKEWYLSSLSEEIGGIKRKNVFKTVLIPFSNKAWNYLKSFKDLRSFAAATNGVRSTDEQYKEFLDDVEFHKWQDETYEKTRNQS